MVKSARARGKQPTSTRPNRLSDSKPTSPLDPAAKAADKLSAALSSSSVPTTSKARKPMLLSEMPTYSGNPEEESQEPATPSDNPNLRIATPGSGGSKTTELVFYIGGVDLADQERAQPDFCKTLPKGFTELVVGSMYKFCPTLVPTTYEAAGEYLREEKMKPKGHRDLRRESCYLSFTTIDPSIGKPTVYLTETQTLIPVAPGHSLAVPTIDCPPWAFDHKRNTDPTIILFDPENKKPLEATAIMTYFTNTDPNQKHGFNSNETNIIMYKGEMYE